MTFAVHHLLSTAKPIEIRPVKQDEHKTPACCEVCYEKASVEALFEMPETIVVQRFCDKCISDADYQ
jgi:hypothetical protein